MSFGRRRVSKKSGGHDGYDFDDDAGTLTRLRIESHSAHPVSTREVTRPGRDPFGRTPTAEYPEGLLERLRIRVALSR